MPTTSFFPTKKKIQFGYHPTALSLSPFKTWQPFLQLQHNPVQHNVLWENFYSGKAGVPIYDHFHGRNG
jgi:hypothetical protein